MGPARAQPVVRTLRENRSKLDLLGGFFGVFVRGVVEGRVEREAPQIVRALRRRLEEATRRIV